jgi:glycosyltransferase involved in cell wall biosynthesis
MRRVLFVTYYFPPAGGIGVQRPLRWIRLLPEFGWEPVVLAPDNPDYPLRDEKLVREIPDGLIVVRAPIREPYRLYRRWLGRRGSGPIDTAGFTREERKRLPWRDRLAETIRAAVFIPDARIGWYAPALARGLEAIRSLRPDAVLSTAPPYTTHLIARTLARRAGLPWAADFRDSWIGWHSTPRRPFPASLIDRRLERAVTSGADVVLAASRGVSDDLRSRSRGGNRFEVLYNGYDVPPPPPRRPGDRMIITYTGTLFPNTPPWPLLDALDAWGREEPAIRDRIRVRFVGRISPEVETRLASARYAPFVERGGFLDHERTLAAQAESDVLLLLLDESLVRAGVLTGKLFEYFGARRPVLAVCPDGEAAGLVREMSAGVVAPPETAAVAKEIRALFEAWREGRLISWGFREGSIARLHRREQVRRLGKILEEIAPAR